MHLFPELTFRELLHQAADQKGSDDDRHLLWKLLLHPRAARAAHLLIEHQFEQTVPNDQVQAIAASAAAGDFVGILQWILDNWPTIVADILTALKMFGLLH